MNEWASEWATEYRLCLFSLGGGGGTGKKEFRKCGLGNVVCDLFIFPFVGIGFWWGLLDL